MPVSKPVPYRLAIPQYRGEPHNRRNMAGVHGFEPGNAGIKNRCLTAAIPIRATLTGMVREARLELAHLAAPEPKSGASTNFATPQKDGGYDGIRTCDPIIMSDVALTN